MFETCVVKSVNAETKIAPCVTSFRKRQEGHLHVCGDEDTACVQCLMLLNDRGNDQEPSACCLDDALPM